MDGFELFLILNENIYGYAIKNPLLFLNKGVLWLNL